MATYKIGAAGRQVWQVKDTFLSEPVRMPHAARVADLSCR